MRTKSANVKDQEQSIITEDLQDVPVATKRRGRPKKSNSNVNGSGDHLVSVGDLRPKSRPAIATVVDGKTLYIRAASIATVEDLDSAENSYQQGVIVANYLAENLFNDEEGTKPVGTAEEFKKSFGPAELSHLFHQLNEGIVLRQKKKKSRR